MNVAFDSWIPVVTLSGVPKLASLKEVFAEGDQLSDLAVRPHERVALMRLFLCVAHAALNGPKDYDEWETVPERLPEAAVNYLSIWKDSFELFHSDKPWLQVRDLKSIEREGAESGKTSPIALLDFELATGNNSTLFDHAGQQNTRNIEIKRVALTLLTFQNFSSGGGSPVAQWGNIKTSQVGNPDAPCLSQSMAHCLFRGHTIAETIHLNIPTYEVIGMVYKEYEENKKAGITFSNIAIGKPVWENFPESADNELASVANATMSYIGRLVPISRWVRLISDSDQMYCSNGFKYKTFRDGFAAEPTAVTKVTTKKEKSGKETQERRVVSVDPTKALWRELSALLVNRSAEGLGGALAMSNAPRDKSYDFHVCAITRDQASMDIAVESVFHITPGLGNNFSIYQEEVIGAERYARKLGWAIEDYRKTVDDNWESRLKRAGKDKGKLQFQLHSKATRHYWTAVESNLTLLMIHIEAVGTDSAIPTRNDWRKMLFISACDAYRVACGQETPRQIRAFAKGWQKLTSMDDKSKPETYQTKEEVA